MLLKDRDQGFNSFISDRVKNSDICLSAVDPEHPACALTFSMDLKLPMIDFAFVNLNDTWQLKIRQDSFASIKIEGLAEEMEVVDCWLR